MLSSSSPRVESGAEWFSMIIAYLKLKSFGLWLQCHPFSNYQEFELAWPAWLDLMMASATKAAIAQLADIVITTLN
jgi:hypothetical protein